MSRVGNRLAPVVTEFWCGMMGVDDIQALWTRLLAAGGAAQEQW